MSYFKWAYGIELDHAEIDEQHKRLLLLGEELVEPLIGSMKLIASGTQLQALIDFAQEHFAFEENLMRSSSYPGTDEHARLHTLLLADLRAYCSRMERGLHTDPVGLISFLWHWIVLHIGSEDRTLVTWLKSNNQDGRG